MAKELDVIVLSWNRPKRTQSLLRNLLSQIGVTLEIFVVDQGSDSEAVEMLRGFQSRKLIQLIELGENKGVAEGRNIGIQRGEREIVVEIDNDALFQKPDALTTVAGEFERDSELGALSFRILDAKSGQDERKSWCFPRQLWSQREQGFLASRYSGCGHALRRSAVLGTNLYDPRLFFYWEELDLSYQLIQSGYKIRYEPAVVVEHYRSSEMRSQWAENRFYFLVRNALYLGYKYRQDLKELIGLSLGYLIKGLYNGIPIQTIRGIVAARSMAGSLQERERIELNDLARSYIQEHDRRHRGGILRRIRNEVLERLE